MKVEHLEDEVFLTLDVLVEGTVIAVKYVGRRVPEQRGASVVDLLANYAELLEGTSSWVLLFKPEDIVWDDVGGGGLQDQKDGGLDPFDDTVCARDVKPFSRTDEVDLGEGLNSLGLRVGVLVEVSQSKDTLPLLDRQGF